MKIILDMDAILADLNTEWITEFNRRHGTRWTVDDCVQWDMEKNFNCGPEVYDILKMPGLYRNLKPMDGAIEGVKKLHEAGHDLLIISAAGPYSAKDKMDWMAEHFPFISYKNIGMIYNKYVVRADAIIDDGAHNLLDYKKHWPEALTLGIECPWNKAFADKVDLLAPSHKNPSQAWKAIVEYIEEHANV